jgi:hypothetical protein
MCGAEKAQICTITLPLVGPFGLRHVTWPPASKVKDGTPGVFSTVLSTVCAYSWRIFISDIKRLLVYSAHCKVLWAIIKE